MPKLTEPKRRWKLQDAKARLSELVRLAESEGPQVISRHGEDAVVVVRMEQWAEHEGKRKKQSGGKKKKESFLEFMRRSPLYGKDIDFSREPDYGRDIEL
ncbi:MAG: type II toxin-antitoxin system prevent-host-death family antitoxin [Bryobacteraceae bacterium]|nr:type II toxin-antitoxin system prevent-host-death family antitoxin [Solibacteraceae bacterium]MCL4843830.1 type II toxin-antitoxin system prevent-host-death family antitoxin [Bryobacteraceae bacterium]MCO5352947.1 type II toxin-antitoxin system prevent-host-death family antitoxin [Bryobacteraceae bacterium]